MELIKLPAYILRHKIKKKEVVCFGAGLRLNNMCKDFIECRFENYIKYVVDNNSSLWDSTKEVNGKSICIKSPGYLRKHITSDTVIVISADKVNEIYRQLLQYDELQNVICYQYPLVRYLSADLFDGLFSRLPLRNTIMFQGEGDSCENATALTEYFQTNQFLKKYKIVWLCSHTDRFTPTKHLKYINRRVEFEDKNIFNIWRYHYYRYTSKYLMYENKFIQKCREEQISIYLKHGTFMVKNVKGKIVIPKNVNYAICTSENYAEHAAEQESISRKKLMICGSPRLDYLYRDKNALQALGIYKEDKNYVIWLPTMRQASFANMRVDSNKIYTYGIPLMQSEFDFQVLNEKLEKMKLILIVKPHPRQNLAVFNFNCYENIVLVTQDMLDEKQLTVHSLMRETQALISDYSSIAFDYMLLNRPIAYTVDDMEEYTIGFSVPNPFDYMPGEKLKDINDMIGFLEQVKKGEDPFCESRNKIKDYIHAYQDDKNCERFVQMLDL